MSSTCIILAYVWPELNASAASWRTENLLECLQEADYRVELWSHAKPSTWTEYWQSQGVTCRQISLNCTSFDEAIRKADPEMVVFDRFITEEQFSWRVQQTCPNALRILDTQDLHFLRHHREQISRKTTNWEETIALDLRELSTQSQQRMLREIASIYRSDISLIISEFELALLVDSLSIPESKLCYFPLLRKGVDNPRLFSERKDFASLGNFRHPPNLEANLRLVKELWPEIRKKLPNAKLHIAGAYPPKEITELIAKDASIVFSGQVECATSFLADKIALLAPLRFGAGLKGKVLDAWSVGTPVLSTSIGSEGYPQPFAGIESNDYREWPLHCERLLTEGDFWQQHSECALNHLQTHFNRNERNAELRNRIVKLEENLSQVRRTDLVGALLWQSQSRSTEFFSRYLQLKESMQNSEK